MTLKILVWFMPVVGILAVPGLVLAAAYGEGVYGSGLYSANNPTPVLQIGPLTLPNTGGTWMIIIGAGLAALGVGLWVWLRQKHKQRSVS